MRAAILPDAIGHRVSPLAPGRRPHPQAYPIEKHTALAPPLALREVRGFSRLYPDSGLNLGSLQNERFASD
jgi:hypothetical protein